MSPGKLALIALIGPAAIFSAARPAVDHIPLQTNRDVTYARDVAPILYRSCAPCHRPNDTAPFSVLTYTDVRPWARSIREKVVTREMPPWHADRRYGDFENNPRLAQDEIDTIARWVDRGSKEGDPRDLPPLPAFVDGWKIGRPDRIFAMSTEYTVQAGAPDAYVYAVIHTRFSEDKWIQAAELRPGNKRIVHHAIAHVLTPQAMAKSRQPQDPTSAAAEKEPAIFFKQDGLSRVRADAPVIDDGANAPSGGAVFRRATADEGNDLFSMLLSSYAPGKEPDVYPVGMAKRVPAGSTIVLQLHYSVFRGQSDKQEKDRTSVAVVFAKEPPEKRVFTLTVQNHFFKVPPGAGNHEVTASYTLDQAVELIDYMPHMHLRGKDMKYEVIYPDGRRETLLWVPRFSFNWQTVYRLKRPVRIPKGAKIVVTAHFDNSRKNKYNPDPTRAVRWGDPTYDEMMIGWLEYAVAISTSPGQ